MESMRLESDFESFVERLRQGDAEAADELTDRFSRRLTGLAEKRLSPVLRQKVDAEDAVQSAYKSFFRKCQTEYRQLDGWQSMWLLLARITIRKCRKHHRHFETQQRSVSREATLAGTQLDARFATRKVPPPDQQASINEQLVNLFTHLSARDRSIVDGLLDGQSVSQISTRVGCTHRTTQRVLGRIRAQLSQFAEQP